MHAKCATFHGPPPIPATSPVILSSVILSPIAVSARRDKR
jgi:hypothetical protein